MTCARMTAYSLIVAAADCPYTDAEKTMLRCTGGGQHLSVVAVPE